jgi:uncharacterized protein (DUF4415 family)
MKRTSAEARRPIDFSGAKRGAVAKAQPRKTKISIRLDNEVLEHFRRLVDEAGGGNYQSLINDALRAHIQQQSITRAAREAVKEEFGSLKTALRQVLREEVAAYGAGKVRSR